MIELVALCSQAGFDIPQTFSISQLGKRHGEILVSAGEYPDLVIALIAMDATPERVHR